MVNDILTALRKKSDKLEAFIPHRVCLYLLELAVVGLFLLLSPERSR
jgi:hypothetical protein